MYTCAHPFVLLPDVTALDLVGWMEGGPQSYPVKISRYFIKKKHADRLKAGELFSHLCLFRYSDLTPNNRERVQANDPESLIALDWEIYETG